ncbi:MAG: TerB N-terminal domain-containing protein, partial [Dehalococcoidia bacterium]|nr:TerB N-terminal domain-containing protein [Dehalococcoidia bacterium]
MWVVILAVIVGIGYWIWRESQKAKVAEENRSESSDGLTIRVDVGGLAQSSKRNRGNDAKWLTPGNEVVVAGHSLSSGFVYVCDYPSNVSSRWSDPSLINRSLPVNARAPRTQEIGYWPSYSGLSPGHRAGYLAWLTAGRSAENVEPGYLFVFFYGLERRVLDELMPRTLDEMTPKGTWSEEIDAIAGEVTRLMLLNPNCRSFQMYAGSFVDFLACYKARILGEQIASPTAIANQWDVPPKVRVGLGQLAKAGEPIPARWALSWAYSAPSISLRTPARRCRQQFEVLFTRLYTDRYGEGMVIPPNKTPLTVEYRAASAGVFRRQVQLFMGLPDVTILKRPVDKLSKIVEECTSLLDEYSRALGRKSADTLRGYLPALLPRELLEQATIGEVARLRAWLQESVAPETITTTSASEILSRFQNESPDKLSRRLWELTVLLVGKLGYGVEPNPRYGGKHPSLSGTVCLFRDHWEPERHLSSEFKVASALLPFAVMVCASDGATEAELELISEQLSRLEHNERRRLEARTEVLLDSPPAVRSLRRAVSGLGEQQK